MSTAIPLEEVEANLRALIYRLAPGDEVLITENRETVAKLVSQPRPVGQRQPGLCKGMITLLVEDDEHLQGFQEYMG
jgi:antitoxin (DNA-binding transcriptional repressor) of toxin-antitoxin stability system